MCYVSATFQDHCASLEGSSCFTRHFPVSSSQAYYFDRDDQALHNFAKFFRHQSHEEREHAEKLMKLQNQRGGRIFLQDIRVRVHILSNALLFCCFMCVLTSALGVRFLSWTIMWPMLGGQNIRTNRYRGRDCVVLLIFHRHTNTAHLTFELNVKLQPTLK